MATQNDIYNETTNLYLDILREAQQVEDRKLIWMIRSRLKELREPTMATTDGCEVILFPRTVMPAVVPVEERDFWPKLALQQIAVIFSSYSIVVTAFSIFQ